jgi:hypothetical protein
MKKSLLLLLMAFLGLTVIAQKKSKKRAAREAEEEKQDTGLVIYIGYPTTTHLIFNNNVEYWDLGAPKQEVVLDYAKDNEKVLKLFVATNEDLSFKKTFLTVRINGVYRSYICRVKPDKAVPFIQMNDEKPPVVKEELDPVKQRAGSTSVDLKTSDNGQLIASAGKTSVVAKSNNTKVNGANRVNYFDSSCAVLKKYIRNEDFEYENKLGGMNMALSHCYVKDDKLFFVVRFNNASSIGYDLNSINFSIANRKKGKGNATQEKEVIPIFISDNVTYVKGFNNQLVKVFVLDKFTFDGDNKDLLVQAWEKNGDRNLMVKIKQDDVLKAIPF